MALPRMRLDPPDRPLEQRSGTDPERLSKPVDVIEADVPFAAFDAAHVCPVESRALRQCLLAQPDV